jgi:5S rRNA maturation endonuclease (ribonuclease M5)/Zn-finger protein
MELNQIKQKLIENYDLVFNSLGITYENINDNLYCVCPIHDNSDNPRAFSFSTKRGLWKCWTRDCQNDHKNDVFGLIQAVLSKQSGSIVTFSDTLNWSKNILGINQSIIKSNTKEASPYEDMLNIVDIFKKTKQATNVGFNFNYNITYPSKYFIDRGFSKETLRHFSVGDCYECPQMKYRAIIPIHDDEGKNVVGIIGRSIKEYRIPKFLIYPAGFNKKYSLYNYHRAIEKARETSCLFVVEGQSDVWRLYEAGVHNAVGLFGKTITKEQEEKLYKMPITHIIVLTDNDQAGRESKVEIKRKLGRMYKLSFPQIFGKDVGEMSIDKIKTNILSSLKGTY